MLPRATGKHSSAFVQHLGKQRGQFVSTVPVVFGILIRFIVRNFLAFKGACGSDETGVVSTQHIWEFPLHCPSFSMPLDFWIGAHFLSSGLFLALFLWSFSSFLLHLRQWLSIDQMTSPWETTASSSVYFLHKSIIFGVAGVRLTLLVAIFAIPPLLFVWTVHAGFYFLAVQPQYQITSVPFSMELSSSTKTMPHITRTLPSSNNSQCSHTSSY